MRLATLSPLLSLLTTLTTPILAAAPARDFTLHAWPLSAASPKPLAHIAYTNTNATVQKYIAPNFPTTDPESDDEIVRVGFLRPSSGGAAWSGVATSAGNFQEGARRTVQLHVDEAGSVWHVGFRAGGEGVSGSGDGAAVEGLSVEVVRTPPGPSVRLNKPMVVREDGGTGEEVVEKSFLQKYWWAIAGVLVIQVLSAGGGGKE